MKEISTGVLREIVKDQAAVGTHWITVGDLLERLGLSEPLVDARRRIRFALAALESGDLRSAAVELDLADAGFARLLGKRS